MIWNIIWLYRLICRIPFCREQAPHYQYSNAQPVWTALAAVRNPQKSVATASRRESVYNRAGEPSVIFAEKEELRSEWEIAKGCCERYGANDDMRSTHNFSFFIFRFSFAHQGVVCGGSKPPPYTPIIQSVKAHITFFFYPPFNFRIKRGIFVYSSAHFYDWKNPNEQKRAF